MTNTTNANGINSPRSTLSVFLDVVERVGNRLPDPVTIFVGLAVAALGLSWLVSLMGVSVVHPETGETITAVNLLSRDGIQKILGNMVENFTGFKPLGTVLVAMIGVGIAERTGLFAAMLKWLVTAVPAWAITPTVVFAGILSNTAADAGFVILPPLAGMLYASLGRHPVAGIAAAFAGVGGGFSANIVLNALDPLLSGITNEAAELYDDAYDVKATANYFFMIASVPMLTIVGTLVSTRIVERRLGPWKSGADANALTPLEAHERRGLLAALVAVIVTAGLMIALVVAKNAPLREPDPEGLAPFFRSIVGLIMIFFFVPGLVYGIVTRQVRSDRDASKMMSESMSAMGSYIVLAFFAGQAIAYFGWSNIALIIALKTADFLKSIHFTGVPLLLVFLIVAAIFNLVLASSSAKWAIMAPIFVPMFMNLGWSPETTQCVYRVGDSITNIITPLNYYLPISITAAQRFIPRAGMGTIISATLPYSVAFGLAWIAMLVVWLLLGLPIGPGAPIRL